MTDPQLANLLGTLPLDWPISEEARELARRMSKRRITRRDWHVIQELRAMFKHHPEMTASHASTVSGRTLDYCRWLLSQMEQNGELESESQPQRNGKVCLVYRLKERKGQSE